jgi:hypothetical protein
MAKTVAVLGLVAALAAHGIALGADEPIPAKIGLVKPDKLAKFVSKSKTGFPLPSGLGEDPTVQGAEIAFFDTAAGGGGTFTHALPAAGWTALGNPAGSKGFKYKGNSVGDSTCSVVLIKPKVIKGVCKGSAVTLTTPFAGNDGIILRIPGTGAATLRYCAELGGATKMNDARELERTDAPAPASCPVEPSQPTATATGTPTGTAAATVTATATGIPTGTTGATATATSTSAAAGTSTPTPTITPGASCPLAAGRYTETTTGGTLKVSTFSPFAFPSGGKTIQDVSAGDANCVHTTVVPYPGGLTVPAFCVPALGYTVLVSQTGCGVGEIDSNGGSDFTVSEKGDTSYNLNGCSVTQSCSVFVDSSGDVDIAVGDGSADTCGSGGTANAIVSIPVHTITWLSSTGCPDPDGDPNGIDDTIITQFPQTLDLTTDTSTAQYFDNDGDGCSRAGAGPQGPFSSTGTCIDLVGNTVSVAAGGTVFSSAAPLHDLLFTTVQNSTVSGPTASGGATCTSPPVINFNGLAHRCIVAP